MESGKKSARYGRILSQIEKILKETRDESARMATIIAILHHKMDYFFWTGFYMLTEGELTVRMYQGPVACQVLEKNKGVCWAGFNQKNTIIVDDVRKFPGHIACDSRSRSEIVVPLKNSSGEVTGVLDVDSREIAAFDTIDAVWLEKITALVNPPD